jgi:hypothetical protein
VLRRADARHQDLAGPQVVGLTVGFGRVK